MLFVCFVRFGDVERKRWISRTRRCRKNVYWCVIDFFAFNSFLFSFYFIFVIARVLSTVASTACFDKSPQSKERGITLDLGFSSFSITEKEFGIILSSFSFKKKTFSLLLSGKNIQFTIVDCPGHASLIKTIIGGLYLIFFFFIKSISCIFVSSSFLLLFFII